LLVLRTGAVAIPAAGALVLLAPGLARLLFGSAYAHDAAVEIRILAPGMGLMVMQSLTAAVIFMADEHRTVMRLGSINVTVCVLASFALSAALGAPGAALALALSEAVSFFSFAWLVRRRYARPAVACGSSLPGRDATAG
jgi:O-antigen/teichoic acid export membrane protein